MYITHRHNKAAQKFVQSYPMRPISIFSPLSTSATAFNVPCPLLYEFYQTAFDSYTTHITKKIKQHLEPKQHPFLVKTTVVPKYEDISDQQLSRRGQFMNIVLDYLLVVKQLSTQPNQDIFKDRGLKQQTYRGWLKEIILTTKQISELADCRKELTEKGQSDSKVFINAILPSIFDTELYALQIMLRVYSYQLILEENHTYFIKLKTLNHQYQDYVFEKGGWESDALLQCEEKQMNKSTKLALKGTIKQIDRITQLYWLELSFNRSNAKVKPELQCMLDILNEKIQNRTFRSILSQSKQLGKIYNYHQQFSKSVIFEPCILQSNKLEQKKEALDNIQDIGKIVKYKVVRLEGLHLSPQYEAKSAKSISQIEEWQEKVMMTPEKSKSQPTKSAFGNSEQRPLISYRTAEPKVQQNLPPPKASYSHKPERTYEPKPTAKEDIKIKQNNKTTSKQNQRLYTLNNLDKLQQISKSQRFGQNPFKRLIKPKKIRDAPEVELEGNKPKQYFYEARQHQLNVRRMEQVEDNYLVLAEETPSERRYGWADE